MRHTRDGRWKSKRLRWGNRTGDVKVLDRKSPKWLAANGRTRQSTGYLTVEERPARNADLLKSTFKASDSRYGYGRRAKDRFSRRSNHRGMVKYRYGGYVDQDRMTDRVEKHLRGFNRAPGAMAGSRMVNAFGPSSRTPQTHVTTSLLAYSESRLDVVLWRAGLTKTRPQAHQRCAHGHVQVQRPGHEPRWRTHPSYLLKPGTRVDIRSELWRSRKPVLLEYWRDPLNQRKIPPYLLVDRVRGSVVFDHVPEDGEVVLPTCLKRSVHSRRK